MLKRIKNLLQDKALYFAILFTITIAILSLSKMPKEGISVPSSDKLSHLIAYFFLMLAWLYSIIKQQNFKSKVKYVVFGCFIYGIIIEVLQSAITSYRTASYLDILANSMGILLAILTFYIFEKKNLSI